MVIGLPVTSTINNLSFLSALGTAVFWLCPKILKKIFEFENFRKNFTK